MLVLIIIVDDKIPFDNCIHKHYIWLQFHESARVDVKLTPPPSDTNPPPPPPHPRFLDTLTLIYLAFTITISKC